MLWCNRVSSVVDSRGFGLEAVAGICEVLYAIRLGVIQPGSGGAALCCGAQGKLPSPSCDFSQQ